MNYVFKNGDHMQQKSTDKVNIVAFPRKHEAGKNGQAICMQVNGLTGEAVSYMVAGAVMRVYEALLYHLHGSVALDPCNSNCIRALHVGEVCPRRPKVPVDPVVQSSEEEGG